MVKNQSHVVICISFWLLLLSNAAIAQTCPPPQQPMLSNALESLILGGQADDAMQCVIDLDDNASELPDDVRYQLAKNASDAIEALGGDVNVLISYNERATKLWDTYLQNVSPPFDQGRISFALIKLMQHGRFSQFEQFFPSIAKAFNRGRARIAANQADQLFTTIKRCPAWNVVARGTTGNDRGISCAKPCPDIAQSLLSALSDELGQRPWAGPAGIKRLAVNAKALEDSLKCTPP